VLGDLEGDDEAMELASDDGKIDGDGLPILRYVDAALVA